MPRDQDCIRKLLLYIDQTVRINPDGTVRPMNLQYQLESPELSDYSRDTLFASAKFLVDRKFVRIYDPGAPGKPNISHKTYEFTGVTEKGLDYITIVKDDATWETLVSKAGSVFEKPIPALMKTASEEGIKFMLD